ncbi:MAG TPA: GatB/YqeY domain-containing protein [Kiritimatiellia bacterium]|nr:GatB/YqeY domain-containing protein [Kiritimatiellia bacterium]
MASKIYDEMQSDVKEAMKARAADKVTAMRTLIAQIKDATINAGKDVTDGEVATVVSKAIKQRQDSVEQFRAGGREDLATKEQAEIDLFRKYMPKQLDEAEIEALATKAIAESGATGKADLGKVMKVLMPQVKGKADGKLVNAVVGRLLG